MSEKSILHIYMNINNYRHNFYLMVYYYQLLQNKYQSFPIGGGGYY